MKDETRLHLHIVEIFLHEKVSSYSLVAMKTLDGLNQQRDRYSERYSIT